MPTIQILVRVTETISTELPGPIAQGKQFIFSDNLVLEVTTTARQEAACRTTSTSGVKARSQDL